MHEVVLNASEKLVLDRSIRYIEDVFDATCYALVMTDSRGTFLHYRPGCEREVSKFLSQIDWTGAHRVVEEHTL
jgi:hypothetical protein